MKSITNALNNIALAIGNLAAAYKNSNVINKTTTSNPVSYSQNVKYYPSPYSQKLNSSKVAISTEEYEAIKEIYNALTDKGAHPFTEDCIDIEMRTKWPVLSRALYKLMKSYDYDYKLKNQYDSKKYDNFHKTYDDIWKNK